ncbi:response regulator [Parathalassolituus penaei]|uniref:Response regulator n=1 Tax=Parathalassolituus penaei TaxID=2997323 RepID=A0A9X3EDD0_9GAMM|nr:response regulator [Parathalassolituus penaei]MCY0965523.1 response regulator [Parathalassolituus penaei]
MAKFIYIVDDSLTMLMSLRGTLELSGFQVETADNPHAALQRLSSIKPDLIITDINMPQMDGLELIQALRAGSQRFTPILTLTTESQGAKRDEAKRLGATGWLVKPISSADLTAVIRKILPGA